MGVFLGFFVFLLEFVLVNLFHCSVYLPSRYASCSKLPLIPQYLRSVALTVDFGFLNFSGVDFEQNFPCYFSVSPPIQFSSSSITCSADDCYALHIGYSFLMKS